MGSETFSEFLIPLKFKLDEPSKKKFDAAILETEKRFKAIGTAAAAAAAVTMASHSGITQEDNQFGAVLISTRN